MTMEMNSQDRLAVVVSYLSPFIGFPLLGPWLVHALLPESSQAKDHAARAFDLHLGTLVLGFVSIVLGFVFFGDTGAIAAAGVFVIAVILDIVLLVGALAGGRMSAPWQPVVLGRRKFYQQQPFIR